MINTIFYFPESLTFEEYTNKLTQKEISDKTIVFAKEQKSIYMGGVCYTESSNKNPDTNTEQENNPEPIQTKTIYYGFAPEEISNVAELNSENKQSVTGTYNITNNKDYSAYLWFVIPQSTNINSIILSGGLDIPIPSNNPVNIVVGNETYKAIRSEEGDFEQGTFKIVVK